MRNETKDIKVFAGGIGVICQIIAVASWWKGGSVYPYVSVIGIIFATIGLSSPRLIKPIYDKWMVLAMALGRFQTKLILGIIFYLVITPIAIFLRLLGKDLLDLKPEADSSTYWKKRDPMQDSDRFEKQF